MNKNDLIAKVSEVAMVSKSDTTKVIEAMLDQIVSAMKAGDEVRLVGFGSFTAATRAASEGRNPRTGEKIAIPASKQPKFKAGTELKRLLNS